MWTIGKKLRLDNGQRAVFKRMDGEYARVMVILGKKSCYDLLIKPERIVGEWAEQLLGQDKYLEDIIRGEIK